MRARRIALRTEHGRLLAALLAAAGVMPFSTLQAQVSPPSTSDISPSVNTDVSSLIHTGCGYDAWTGSVHRRITDLEVPGAVSTHGLKWVRTYNSGSSGTTLTGWSFSYTWRYWGRGWGGDATAVYLPDGGIWRTNEPGMKLRFIYDDDDPVKGCPSHDTFNGCANLYLQDGSRVYMARYTDWNDNNLVDYYTPQYVDDPYGRRTTLEYEEPCVFGNGNYIRLKQVTDPSGRFIRIRYACDANDCQSCTTSNWYKVTRVEGSDGSWVNYHYNGNDLGSYLTHVDYSDGSSADYTYDDTTYLYQACCGYPDCNSQCWFTGHSTQLITAVDTHADSPMQSIKYDYSTATDGNKWKGAVRTERHLASNVVVSTLTSNSTPGRDSATQTETRGDGPWRTLYIEKGTQHVRLVKRKSDFPNHVNEAYTYDSSNYLTSVQDRNGNTTQCTNESVIGNPTRITHPDGTHIAYTYSDANNPYHIHTVTNERGKMTTYTRGTVGNLRNLITRIDYPADANTPASYETFEYNNFGQVWKHRRSNGAYEYAAYDGTGLLIKLWNATYTSYATPFSVPDSDPHITLTHYPAGHAWQERVQTVTYPATGIGQVPSETYEYDRAFAGGVTDPNGAAVHGRGLVTKITHADWTFQRFGYDVYGNKRWEENELGKRTSCTYDDYKRLLTVTNPLIKTATYTYNSTNGGSSFLHTTNSIYTSTTPTGIVTKNVYDANFRKTSTTAAYGTSQAATTSFAYDNVGNLTDVTEPLAVTHNTYDTRNRKITATEAYGTNLAHTTTWHYDEASNIYQIDRPDGTHETKTYDALNRVLTDTVPQTTSVNLTTTFAYNPSGTVASVTVPQSATVNLTTSFSYDASDQRIMMTYPNGGGTQSWAYDDVHNPKWRITVNNEAQYFYYDRRNRKYASWWTNWANNIVDWRYFGYDAASRLTEAENGTGGWAQNVISDVHRFYDDANHLTLEQQIVTGLGTMSVNYPTYNDDGKLTSMNVTGVPDYNYTFSYDVMGRFEKIFITNGPQLFQYYYDAASNERQRDNVYDGVQQIYPRDALNRIQYLDVKKGNSTLGHEGYGYDAMNRLTSVTREDNRTDAFGYYLDGELNTAYYGNTQRNVSYTLDRAGNRTSVVDNGTTKSYSRNTLNQYTTAESSGITNGPEHEIQTSNGVTYTYINDERLSSASSTGNSYSLVYDALGRCVKRTLNTGQPNPPTTYYVYDGEKPILEYDTTGNRVGFNLYGKGIDEILERGAHGTDNAWHWYFFQQDHEGSVTHLTDASGNIIERYRYDAFGAPTIYAPNWTVRSATIYDNRFLFTGREYAATYRSTYNVPAFKFYEYRARAYNPTLGRFMSEDPKLFDAGDYNLYRYCHNDPLDMTDPMGLDFLSSTSDFVAGAGDFISFGATGYIRGSLPGIYGFSGVNTSSFAYHAGEASGFAVGALTGKSEAQLAARTGGKAIKTEVAAVIGKFSNSPNYLEVAEKIGAKKFNVPPHIWEKMSEAERWAANQKFLDRAIARGGDFMLDKPIKEIASVKGELRKELDYLGQKGFRLGEDGSRMVRPAAPPRPPPFQGQDELNPKNVRVQ